MFFKRKKIIWAIIAVTLVIIVLLTLINQTWSNLIVAILGSIVSGFAISAFYNNELHTAMDMYIRIGLGNYYENFELVQNEIRTKIATGKTVDIYVMYANTFFNSSILSLKQLLAKEGAHLRIFLYSDLNPFIASYGNLWGVEDNNQKYNAENLRKLISQVKSDLSRLLPLAVLSKFELYEIKSSPISYSFYKIDNDLYLVPSKNTKSREFKPPVLHFVRTTDIASMFYKIEKELEQMIASTEVIKIN